MTRFERLLRRLTLSEESPGVFVGGAGEGGVGSEARLFGGLVAAQAVVAAQNTVPDFRMHSLHAYFLRPGRAARDIAYHVTAVKDGRNFRSRRVEAWQGGDCVFQLMASFQRASRRSDCCSMPGRRPLIPCSFLNQTNWLHRCPASADPTRHRLFLASVAYLNPKVVVRTVPVVRLLS